MRPLAAQGLPGESGREKLVGYFNLYRLVVASLLLIFGLAAHTPEHGMEVHLLVLITYWCVALLVLLHSRGGRAPVNALLFWQVGFDIVVLTSLMFLGSRQETSIPYVLMSTLAGAALVGEGRMVLGFAAMATIAVLVSELARVFLQGLDAEQLARTGFTCMGYFAIALLARLLARRARENESLARQRGEALARQISLNANVIEDMQDGVVAIDADDRVLQINPRAVEMLGVSLVTGEELGVRAPELMERLSDAVASDGRLRVARTGASLHVRCVQASGSGDRLIYLEDMDRVEAQARQIKLAALGRLTANIAHEIRNPLASIVQAAELLREEKRAQMQLRLSQIALDNAKRIDRIVHDVLEVGRRDRITQESLDAAAFLLNFIEEFSLHSSSARDAVVLDARSGGKIRFDRVHLAQILGNLVSNALRYCSQQPGAVTITLDSWSHDGKIVIAIRDDGPGIPASECERVFEPFHTTDPKGTGLGLFVARELAEANGASLMLIESEPGAEFQLIAVSGDANE